MERRSPDELRLERGGGGGGGGGGCASVTHGCKTCRNSYNVNVDDVRICNSY